MLSFLAIMIDALSPGVDGKPPTATLSQPPLHIPGADGKPYKTELVIERTAQGVAKINWWHAPDDQSERAEPHNHPWDFTSTVLYGSITHKVYWKTPKGVECREETWRAGETYKVTRDEFHVVTAVAPGTVTMMQCGPEQQDGEWGYLNPKTGKYTKNTIPRWYHRYLRMNNRFLK